MNQKQSNILTSTEKGRYCSSLICPDGIDLSRNNSGIRTILTFPPLKSTPRRSYLYVSVTDSPAGYECKALLQRNHAKQGLRVFKTEPAMGDAVVMNQLVRIMQILFWCRLTERQLTVKVPDNFFVVLGTLCLLSLTPVSGR